MTAKLFLLLGMVFAIVSQSQALLGQDVGIETHFSHKNDRRIESVPSRVSRGSHIKRDTRISQKIRDLRRTSDSTSTGGGKGMKKTKKSAKSMSKHNNSKEEDGNEGNDSDGSDGNEDNDSDDSDGNASPEGTDFDISDCGSYSNEWLTELAKYCGDDLEDLSGCECPPARELLADGTLACATENELGMSPPACPEDCPVCEFCMVLEGCEDIYDT